MGWDVLVVIIGQRSSKIAFGANKRGCQILLCGIGLQEGYPPSQTGISPIFFCWYGGFPPTLRSICTTPAKYHWAWCFCSKRGLNFIRENNSVLTTYFLVKKRLRIRGVSSPLYSDHFRNVILDGFPKKFYILNSWCSAPAHQAATEMTSVLLSLHGTSWGKLASGLDELSFYHLNSE